MPDTKEEKAEQPAVEKKRPGSPGRYSLADEEDAVPANRIDSTLGMNAVRPSQAMNAVVVSPPSPSSSGALPKADRPNVPPNPNTPKKAPIALPTKPHPTNRGMPAPLAKNAAPTTRTGAQALADIDSLRPPPEGEDSPEKEADKAARAEAMASRIDRLAAEMEAVEASVTPRPSQPPSRPPSIAPPPGAQPRRSSSLRPPSPPKAKSIAPPPPPPSFDPPSVSLDNLDENSIMFAFDALVSEGTAGEAGKHEFDLQPVRELFSELAANHMRHVRDFMIDVKWGEVTRDWIHICLPPVRTLKRAAERLELAELMVALDNLGSELDTANATGGQMLDADEKKKLLDSYGKLVDILPQAFALDRDKSQREAVIVQALLLQVPDVRKVTIDKLHAAGLTSLTILFEANANDIAHVAGIPHALAAKIVERVQAYRDELKSASPQDARAKEREKLAALNATLKDHHDQYEAAANGWGPDAKARKRDHFRGREETWLEISVLLARFGEVERLAGIEKVPFAQRITQLTDYLEEARDKYRAAEA